MKIAFTICSNNYLAHAKALKDSFLQHNSAYIFFIGLVDRIDKEIDYSWMPGENIISVEQLGIKGLESLYVNMNIVELNTSVKPAYFKFLFNKYKSVEHIHYFDPDLYFYDSIDSLDKRFDNADVLLTPHLLTPTPLDGLSPQESVFLNYGLYNLGFIGFKSNSNVTKNILDWWEERCLKFGFNRPWEGLFVDQLWINLIPIYYERIFICKEPGFNMAPWNLHERSIVKISDETILLNNNSRLCFYHFSSYDFQKPNEISKYYNRGSLDELEYLRKLYHKYRQALIENKIEFLKTRECYFVVEKRRIDAERQKLSNFQLVFGFAKSVLRGLTPTFIVDLYRQNKK